jgi:hypothetical protein
MKKLAGAMKLRQWAKPRCFREFRGRGRDIETCIEAVDDALDRVSTGRSLYFSEAVDETVKACSKRPMDDQIPCITGATEVLLKSKGVTASLDGRKRKKRRRR